MQQNWRRWRRRSAALGAVSVLAAGLAVVAGPSSAAHAIPGSVPCPTVYDVHYGDDRPGGYGALIGAAKVISSSPGFLISDGRVVTNDLDIPVTVTFSSSVAKTFTTSITTKVTTETALIKLFKLEVSVTITSTTTTQLGVSAQLVVAPHTTVIGEYGAFSFIVTFDAQYYTKYNTTSPPTCFPQGGLVRETVVVPTVAEGWRFVNG
jgi:hypothetical protein